MLLQLAKRRMDPQSAEYRAYCRYLVPRLGRWITNMPEALDYMTASILEYPDKKECKQPAGIRGLYRCVLLEPDPGRRVHSCRNQGRSAKAQQAESRHRVT